MTMSARQEAIQKRYLNYLIRIIGYQAFILLPTYHALSCYGAVITLKIQPVPYNRTYGNKLALVGFSLRNISLMD